MPDESKKNISRALIWFRKFVDNDAVEDGPTWEAVKSLAREFQAIEEKNISNMLATLWSQHLEAACCSDCPYCKVKQARIEGARKALEAAAREADVETYDWVKDSSGHAAATCICKRIRSLDIATILKEGE